MDSNTLCFIVIIIPLIVFGFITSPTKSLLFKSQQADIVPLDKLVFVGESWTFTCTVRKNVKVDIGNVSFRITSTKNNFIWSVPANDHHVVDNRTVTASVEIKDEFLVDPTVECLDGQGRQLRSGFIYVERPVQNVADFTAYYLYDDHLNMTWSLSQDYMNIEKIGVNLCWNAINYKTTARCGESPLQYFVINQSDMYITPIFVYVWVTVYHKSWSNRPVGLNSSTVFDTNVTSEHKIYMMGATKSGPPEDLKVTSINSSCISVAWSDPRYLKLSRSESPEVFHYNIDYMLQNSTNLWEGSEGQDVQRTLPITVCGLRPFREYKVRVRVKRSSQQPWSDWSYVDTMTDEDRPLKGPPLTRTSFYTGECFNGRREVFVYWQRPTAIDLQGHLTGYKVEVQPKVNLRYESTLVSTKNYAHFHGADCDTEYNISVYSTTKAGRSETPSVIIVPRYNENPQVVTGFKIEYFLNSTRNLVATWDPYIQSNWSLIIYSCRENTQSETESETCLDDYRYIQVDTSVGALQLEQVDPANMLFGYALEIASGQSGGLRWTKCVYSRNNVPESVKPSEFQVFQGETLGSLKITWNPKPCNKKALVQYYTIYVCDGTAIPSLDRCQEYSHNATGSSLTVNSLKDDHEYNVSIRATSPFNLSSEMADFKVGKTKYKLSDDIIVGIVIGVLVALILLGVCAHLARKIRNSKRKFMIINQGFEKDFIKEIQSQPVIKRVEDSINGQTMTSITPQSLTQHSKTSSIMTDEGNSSDSSDAGPEQSETYVRIAQTKDEPIAPTTTVSQTCSSELDHCPSPLEIYNVVAERSEQARHAEADSETKVAVIPVGSTDGNDDQVIHHAREACSKVCLDSGSQNDHSNDQQVPGYIAIAEMNNSIDSNGGDNMVTGESALVHPVVCEGQESPAMPEQVTADYQKFHSISFQVCPNDPTKLQTSPEQYQVKTDYQPFQPIRHSINQYNLDYQSNCGQTFPEPTDNLTDHYTPTSPFDHSGNIPDWPSSVENWTGDQSISYTVNNLLYGNDQRPSDNQLVNNDNQYHLSGVHNFSEINNNTSLNNPTSSHIIGLTSAVDETQTFSVLCDPVHPFSLDTSSSSSKKSSCLSDTSSFAKNGVMSEEDQMSLDDSIGSERNEMLTFVNNLNLLHEPGNMQISPDISTYTNGKDRSTLGDYQTSMESHAQSSAVDRTSLAPHKIPAINNFTLSQYHHNPSKRNTSSSSSSSSSSNDQTSLEQCTIFSEHQLSSGEDARIVSPQKLTSYVKSKDFDTSYVKLPSV